MGGIPSALRGFVMQRLVLVASCTLFLGSAGAFYLFVPLLSILTVASMLLGLMLMFGLGFQAGTQRIPPSRPLKSSRGSE